jgi:hypothetical protein
MVTEVEGVGKTMNNTSTQKKKVLVTGASGLLVLPRLRSSFQRVGR